jgi:hypothetical protein
MHTQGYIPQSAIRYWKGMLHALNHAFSKESMDLLLFLHQRGTSHHWYSADGVLRFVGLFAAGLVKFGKESSADSFVSSETMEHVYVSCHEVMLSEKGILLVEAWKSGDEARYKAVLEQ